jgi:hypothetical protein
VELLHLFEGALQLLYLSPGKQRVVGVKSLNLHPAIRRLRRCGGAGGGGGYGGGDVLPQIPKPLGHLFVSFDTAR